jgi:formaldehyde-activating enzyme involved in methanogenesis
MNAINNDAKPYLVTAKMKLLKKKSKDYAKLFQVHESAISKALAGHPAMKKLLNKMDKYSDYLLKLKGLEI